MTTDSSTGDWTPERIREARERCERATPGPWAHLIRQEKGQHPADDDTAHVVRTADGPITESLTEHDAAFIAHARADLPDALAEIARLRAEPAARAPERSAVTALLDAIERVLSTEPNAPLPTAWDAFYRAVCLLLAKLAQHRAAVDASRPGLTEEQAPTPAEMLAACTEEGFGGFGQGFVTGVLAERARLRWLPVVTENQPYIADGKTGNPTEEPCDPESCHGGANGALLRASRSKDGPASAKEMPSVKPCPAFFGLAGSVYGAQPGDRCDACKRTRAEHGASQ